MKKIFQSVSGPLLLVIFIWTMKYWLSLPFATELTIYTIFVMGCDFLYGGLGMVSFGQPVYMSLGAYATAFYLAFWGSNPLIGILIAILAGVVAGAILGPVFVRLRGDYFALINLAACAIGFFLVMKVLQGFTGADDGIWYRSRMSVLPLLDIRFPKQFFTFLLIVFFCTVIFYRYILGSAFGTACRAIKDNERKAQFLGYNPFRIKWTGFTLSCALSAFSGSLFAINFGFVNPSLGEPLRAAEVLVCTLLGGAGTVYGPFFGAFTFLGIKNIVSKYMVSGWEAVLGALTMILLFIIGKGIWSGISAIWESKFGHTKFSRALGWSSDIKRDVT